MNPLFVTLAQWAGALWLLRAVGSPAGVDESSARRPGTWRDRLRPGRKLYDSRPGTVIPPEGVDVVDVTPASPTAPCVPSVPLPDRQYPRPRGRTAEPQLAGVWDWFSSSTEAIGARWNAKLKEYRRARAQYETDRETARGLIRLADAVNVKAKASGKSPGERAPLRIARIELEGILAGDRGRAALLARVDSLIDRAVTRGAPDGLGVLPLLPIAAIGAAIAAIVVAVAWMRTHSQTIALESRKLSALAKGLLTSEQLTALAETGAPLSLGGTVREFGKVALVGAAVLAGVLLYSKRRSM